MPELLPFEPGTPEWLAARKTGVTATDIVTILGLSHRDSQYSLFWRKLGQVGEVEDNDRFRLGRYLENYVINRWQEEHPDQVVTGNGSAWRHSERAWQMASPDRHVFASEHDWVDIAAPAEAVLEVKSWADADKRAWDTAPPPQVRAQVLWQMDVMDVAVGHVGVVFLPSGEFRSYTIAHENEKTHDELGWPGCPVCVDQNLMRDAGEEFMRRLRLELPPPDPDSSLASLAAVRARFARVPAKQAEIDLDSWIHYESAALLVKETEAIKREYEILIREQAGEAGELCVDGQVVARRIISDATVKEHVRHQDYFRRVKQQGDDDE